jgi:hypothetical protein
MSMNPKEAAADESVREALLRIEDKLYESGVLVTATGDSEADVTLAFEGVAVDKAEVFALVVRVVTDRAARTSRQRWQAFREHVVERYAMLQADFPEDVREALLDCRGPLVFVNGTMTR